MIGYIIYIIILLILVVVSIIAVKAFSRGIKVKKNLNIDEDKNSKKTKK